MVDDGVDAQLVAQWIGGDKVAADALVERHFDGLMSYARHRAFGRLDADEAVQAVFLKLIEKVRTWDPAKGALRSWLITILENEFRSDYRAEKANRRRFPRLTRQISEPLSTPDDAPSLCERHRPHWFDAEVLGSVILILERLRPERAGFLLKPAKGFPCADRAALSRARHHIATKLGISTAGPNLSFSIARELLIVKECGKMPQELFK